MTTTKPDPLSRLKELLEEIKPLRVGHEESTKTYYEVKRRLDGALPIPEDRGDFSYRLQTSLDKYLIRPSEAKDVRRIHQEFLKATATLNAAKSALDPVQQELQAQFDACKSRLLSLRADVTRRASSRLIKVLLPFCIDQVDAESVVRGLNGIKSLENIPTQIAVVPTLEGRCGALVREFERLQEFPA